MKRNRHQVHKKLKDAWYLEHCDMCYIQDKNGTPLYPTRRIERMLRKVNTGKAHIIQDYPLLIQLNYDSQESYMEHEIRLGVDQGSKNLGYAAIDTKTGAVLFLAHLDTKNEEVAEHMHKRMVHRKASRRGERQVRQRRARRNGTTTDRYEKTGRMLPTFSKPIKMKDIKNSPVRFIHRTHSIDKWRTPTVIELVRAQVNIIGGIRRMLPINHISYEWNDFDTEKMKSKETGAQYKRNTNPPHTHKTPHEAIYERQNGKCIICGNDIEHYHHVRLRSDRGSDTQENLVGVCKECHEKLHKGLVSLDIDGLGKKYAGVSAQQQAFPIAWRRLKRDFGKNATLIDSYDVYAYRKSHNIKKTHANDAACIAACASGNIELVGLDDAHCFEIRRYRRHNRALIHSQRERTYVDPGRQLLPCEKKPRRPVVAKNRHARIGQDVTSMPSLEEFRAMYGDDAVSRLIVFPSERHYYSDTNRLLSGVIILYENERYVLSGTSSKGRQYVLIGLDGKRKLAAKSKCVFHEYNKGLVYVA